MRDRILLLLLCLCLSVGMQAQRRSISVLGDSYSTYENFLPAGNAVWYHEPYSAERTDVTDVLTSSSCHPKVFVKEFCYFLMSCHQHCLGVNLLVQR